MSKNNCNKNLIQAWTTLPDYVHDAVDEKVKANPGTHKSDYWRAWVMEGYNRDLAPKDKPDQS